MIHFITTEKGTKKHLVLFYRFGKIAYRVVVVKNLTNCFYIMIQKSYDIHKISNVDFGCMEEIVCVINISKFINTLKMNTEILLSNF